MLKRFAVSVVLCATILFSAPSLALAYPFGGKASLTLPCFLFGAVPYGSISLVGPPNSGLYIWTLATRTYSNGPPAPGKWLLGLTSVPYICVVFPVGMWLAPGITIGMMGSSGGGAPLNTFNPQPAPETALPPDSQWVTDSSGNRTNMYTGDTGAGVQN